MDLPRTGRSNEELIERLRVQISLLAEYRQRAPSDPRFYGEVAAKLRLLVCRFGPKRRQSVPLLVDVMANNGFEARVRAGVKQFTLPELLDHPVHDSLDEIENPTGTATHRLTKIKGYEFIRAWAEQSGGAHEDPDIEDWLWKLFRTEPSDNAGYAVVLTTLADAALDAAQQFFAYWRGGQIDFQGSGGELG
jgi:hypothetical protein